ncbi:MAG: insulinase family protein, partial [Armatimonadetes bacterium]|nr:insulinase family protein [Armatimonadota bacterium]
MSGVLPRLEPHREVLSNGLVLITNRNPDTPSVALRGLRGAGACRDPFGREGLAALTARMLRRGAGARTATEIAAAVEDRGASFYFSTGTEAGGFGAKCLGRDLGRVLELLQVQLEQPTFPESDLEKVREEVLTGLAEDEDSPRVRADRALRRRLYPETHPYARPTSGSPETVRTLSRAECRA